MFICIQNSILFLLLSFFLRVSKYHIYYFFHFSAALPAGAIGARSAMLGKVHLRKHPRKRATNVSTLTGAIPNELGVPIATTPRSGSPSPTRSPSTHSADTIKLDPDQYLQDEEKAAEDDGSEPQVYLSRRYGGEVNARDAALAAEQWKKSQTNEEKFSRKQRQRREHE